MMLRYSPMNLGNGPNKLRCGKAVEKPPDKSGASAAAGKPGKDAPVSLPENADDGALGDFGISKSKLARRLDEPLTSAL
jgi:hypothetical protein